MTELTTKQALAEARKFARFIKSFEHLEAVAAAVEKSQDLTREAENERDKAVAQTAEALERAEAAERQLAAAHGKAAQILADAETERDATISAANEEAARVVGQAENDVALLNDQRDRIALEVQENKQQRDAARQELKAIQARIDVLRGEISNIGAE